MNINVYDFDGTITDTDSLIAFIRYTKGSGSLIRALAKRLPQLVVIKALGKDGGKVKEEVFGDLYRGMTIEEFDRLCGDFARDHRDILRPRAIQAINEAISRGEKVVIVTASVENWVRRFFDGMPVEVIGTKIGVADGRLTGTFTTPNCYGAEKVNRLNQIYPRDSYEFMRAYGDSGGDREILSLADEPHYKPFRQKL